LDLNVSMDTKISAPKATTRPPKINENNQIFEVPGQIENPRRRTLIWP
jgi:hypothetical protein